MHPSCRTGLFIRFPVFMLTLVCMLTACDETVDPIIESDRHFTLFGTLDMNRDTQFVRVIPIRDELDLPPLESLEIRFSSEDLECGVTRVWQDSVITFSDGTYGHIYYIPMRMHAGHTYRIQVEDPSAGTVTYAETTPPPIPRVTIKPDTVSGRVTGGTTRSGSQELLWQGISREPYQIKQWYRFLTQADLSSFIDVDLPYEPGIDLGEEQLKVTLDLYRDRLTLDTLVSVEQFALAGVGLEITLLDEAFIPPGGVFDREILVQPGTMSNVVNGFGFVGSVGRFSTEWVLSDRSQEMLDYTTIRELFGYSIPASLPFDERGVLITGFPLSVQKNETFPACVENHEE